MTAGREQDARETLRALSDAATPGVWEARDLDSRYDRPNVRARNEQGHLTRGITYDVGASNALFIAAAVNYVRAALSASPPATTGAPEATYPRQHKGLNHFLTSTDERLVTALNDWAADQRQRETWRDGDTNTYRYRANLLEAAAARIRASSPPATTGADPRPFAELDRLHERIDNAVGSQCATCDTWWPCATSKLIKSAQQ